MGDHIMTGSWGKHKPCPRKVGMMSSGLSDKDTLELWTPHCYRLSCDVCWVYELARRAKGLQTSIGKEANTVWYGEINKRQLAALRDIKRRNDGVQHLTTTYHRSDTVVVLVSANLHPLSLTEMPVYDAVKRWTQTGYAWRLKKMWSDWDYKGHSGYKHLLTDTAEHLDEVMHKLGIPWGDKYDEDFDELQRNVYRISYEIKEEEYEGDYP